MTHRNQIENIFLTIEFVDDAVVAGAEPIFVPTFEPVMRKIRDLPAEV
jgi:hypothetical protein